MSPRPLSVVAMAFVALASLSPGSASGSAVGDACAVRRLRCGALPARSRLQDCSAVLFGHLHLRKQRFDAHLLQINLGSSVRSKRPQGAKPSLAEFGASPIIAMSAQRSPTGGKRHQARSGSRGSLSL